MSYLSSDSAKPSIIVVGLGNPLMSDEGIGVHLVQQLTQKNPCGGVEWYDGGTGGLSLLYKIENRQKVILVDCAKMGESPGTLRRFTPDQVRSIKQLGHFSLHEMDILKVLELAAQFDSAPKEVVIFGIEPASLELGNELSPALKNQLDNYLTAILAEIPQ